MARDPRPDLASALYPNLSSEAKAREAAQAREKAQREQRKQEMVKDLRELGAALRADRRRGRK